MKSKSSGVNFEREETIKNINDELHRIYGLVNSVDVKFASMDEIEEINNNLHYIRRKLQVYCGD